MQPCEGWNLYLNAWDEPIMRIPCGQKVDRPTKAIVRIDGYPHTVIYWLCPLHFEEAFG